MKFEILDTFSHDKKLYKRLYWDENLGDIRKILKGLNESEVREILAATKTTDSVTSRERTKAIVVRFNDKYEMWVTAQNMLGLLPKKTV